jgi:hypothetical protein
MKKPISHSLLEKERELGGIAILDKASIKIFHKPYSMLLSPSWGEIPIGGEGLNLIHILTYNWHTAAHSKGFWRYP